MGTTTGTLSAPVFTVRWLRAEAAEPHYDGDTFEEGALRRDEIEISFVGEPGRTVPVGRDLGLRLVSDGEIWRLEVDPSAPVRITSLHATISVPLTQADALYLNGYNSWTDSFERSPRAAMKNIGVPRPVIDHWVLDGSGDYRFVPADEHPGRQHGFEYGYLRRGDEVLLVGSLGVDSGFTLLREDLSNSTLELCKEPPARSLNAGEKYEVMSFCVLRDSLDGCVERWLRLMGVHVRPARPLVGYTSWYRHYGDITAKKLENDLRGMGDALGSLKVPGCDKLFQIDDGYAKVGDWLKPDWKKFPCGLARLASEIRDQGFVPGLWLAPFVCERESQLFATHPDWLLRDGHGELVVTGSHWSGQVALDTQNPEVRAYVRKVLGTITNVWGFRFLKCDFLYGACMLPHAGLNRGQLMADALDLLRSSVPDDCLLDFCGVPLVSAFGRADYCRVGCDVGLDWDANGVMRRTGRERVSTKNSLANTRGRAHLDGRAFRNDPDVFFLRDDVKLSESQRIELLRADAQWGGMLLTSDDIAQWDSTQRAAYDAALAAFCAKEGSASSRQA